MQHVFFWATAANEVGNGGERLFLFLGAERGVVFHMQLITNEQALTPS